MKSRIPFGITRIFINIMENKLITKILNKTINLLDPKIFSSIDTHL